MADIRSSVVMNRTLYREWALAGHVAGLAASVTELQSGGPGAGVVNVHGDAG